MGSYSIKDLERLSGIKAHTIRIWEKRYNAIEPQRTETNIRYYDDHALKRLLNISILNQSGLKISKIMEMQEKEMMGKVLNLISDGKSLSGIHIDSLILSLIELDEREFTITLSEIIMQYGFENAIIKVVYPFLEKIGVMWQINAINPAQEHFISNLIRQKLYVAIDGLPINDGPDAKKIIIYLPEHELHEIGTLFYTYLARKNGFNTIYLGQAVPFEDLRKVILTHYPKYLLVSFTSQITHDLLNKYFEKLYTLFPNIQVFATGYQIIHHQGGFPENVTIISNTLEFKELITKK